MEKEGHNSHAGIVGLSLDIPVILGASNATEIYMTHYMHFDQVGGS